MTSVEVELPDPLYQRLQEIAERQDWSLSEVMCKAAEHFVGRFPEEPAATVVWRFPTLDCGGDFLADPSRLRPEAAAADQIEAVEDFPAVSETMLSPSGRLVLASIRVQMDAANAEREKLA